MNAYTYLTYLIIGLIVLAHLGLLYLVIRFAVTHAIKPILEQRSDLDAVTRQTLHNAEKIEQIGQTSRHAGDVFDKG